MSLYVVDLFAGAGGFSLGAHAVTEHVAGVELDADACNTQIKAGMECAQVDVLQIPPENYSKPDPDDRLHLHASPPCQTFSTAGKGEGRSHVDLLATAAYQILTTGTHDLDLEHVVPGSTLVLEPAYWVHKLRPDTVSLEQVRAVKPVWDAFAAGLREIGYSAWSELLYSEQYGVPQTRVRAWLGASLHRDVAPPSATHSRFHVRSPEKFDADVLPWVSMADALSLNGSVGFPRLADGRESVSIDGTDYRARDLRQTEKPSFAVTEKARSWTHIMQGGAGGVGKPRPSSQPSPTMSAKGTATVTDDPEVHWHGDENVRLRMTKMENSAARPANNPASTIMFGKSSNDARWESPATTVQGDPRIWPRGHKINQSDIDRLGRQEAEARYGTRAGTMARRVTVEEAAVLQGFPADHPWQGSKTSQFRQVGNAVCPQVAVAVLNSVLS
jgi:DNA (cytosine-5)-methyltransferase 1